MKLIFVDAENIGLKALSEMNVSFFDKVFVFSNNAEVKFLCEQSLYLYLSGYPQKPNQADFYIIAYLSKALSNLNKQERDKVSFVLYSKDVSLIEAFKFQCDLVNAMCSFPLIEDNIIELHEGNEMKFLKGFLNILSSPHTAQEIMTKLDITTAEFSKIVAPLIKEGKIKRTANNSKKWVAV